MDNLVKRGTTGAKTRHAMRRFGVLVSAAVLTLGAAVFGAPGAAQAWVNGETYLISALHSGKCLDVQDGAFHHTANVLQAHCTSTWNQHWRRQDTGNGWFILVARHSGKCLDVAWQSTDHAANVIQANCWAGYNQQWRIGAVGPGNDAELIARHSGKCLDVAWYSQAHGANVIQGNCSGGANQRWYLSKLYW